MRRSGVVLYPGSYSEYRGRSAARGTGERLKGGKEDGRKRLEPQDAMSPRELSKEIERMEKMVAEIEAKVAADERALRDLESQLANLPADADVLALTRRHQELQDAVAGSLSAWEENAARLEDLQAMRVGAG